MSGVAARQRKDMIFMMIDGTPPRYMIYPRPAEPARKIRMQTQIGQPAKAAREMAIVPGMIRLNTTAHGISPL